MTYTDPGSRIAELQRQLDEIQEIPGDRGWQLAQEAARAAGLDVRIVPTTGNRAYDLQAVPVECRCECPCPSHWDARCRLHSLDSARRGSRGVVEIADWPWPDCRYGARVVTTVNPETGTLLGIGTTWPTVRTVPGGGTP